MGDTQGRTQHATLLRRLAFLVAVVLIAPAWLEPAASAAPPAPARRTPVRIDRRGTNGAARFVGRQDREPLSGPGEPRDTARRFVDDNAATFGLDDPAALEQASVSSSPRGTTVRFRPRVRGLPVLGGELAVQTDGQGRVLSALGNVATPDVDPTPTVTAEAAAERAVGAVAAATGVLGDRLSASAPALVVYDPSSFGARAAGPPVLVWRIEVTGDGPDGVAAARQLVLVDARTGAIVLQADADRRALSRALCDGGLVPSPVYRCDAPFTWIEGQPPTGVADADLANRGASDVYEFFSSRFGRDGYDGAGSPFISNVRFCDFFFPCVQTDGRWDGRQVVFPPGLPQADDVVAHEWTHAYIQYTADVYVIFQAGAINESMADVFGELVDRANGNGTDTPGTRWLVGEDLAGGPVRNMADPTQSKVPQPDRMTSPLYANELIDNGGIHTNSGVGNKTAFLVTDGGTFNGRTNAGLGLDKTALLYWTVLTDFLGPASDYEDLGNALPQACRNLIGTGGFTVNDCLQVQTAVEATELTMQPTTGGGVPDAPECDGATESPTTLFLDDFENQDSNNWGLQDWEYFTGAPQPPRLPPYATSGTTALHGGPQNVGPDQATATLRRDTVIPAGTRTFLGFNGYHVFETGMDEDGNDFVLAGGVIEYSTDRGGSWADISALPAINGYNGTIDPEWPNPLKGRPAYTLFNSGYQRSRFELTTLAGQSVRFRFRIGLGDEGDTAAWFLDDLKVYRCDVPGYHSTTPARILDTRDGTGRAGNRAPVLGGSSIDLQVTGAGGVPSTGVTAVVMNVTAVGATQPTHVTVWPAGVGRPTASNLNLTSGAAQPNLVTVGVGANGKVSLFNNSGAVNLIADVVGWFDNNGPAGRYQPTAPARLLDTRDGTGGTRGPVLGGTSISLGVAGAGGVPAGATSVVLNVTVTGPTAASHVTVWPGSVVRPNASNLNFSAGQTIANLVVVKVGADGTVQFFNNAGATNIIADVVGYYSTQGSRFVAVTPGRVLDTRDGTGRLGALAGGRSFDLKVAGKAGLPPYGATAAVMNVTAVSPTAASHVTVWPAGLPKPLASNINFTAGQTIPNLVMVGLGTSDAGSGMVSFANNTGSVQLVADVVGYYIG